jgi:hypothetical protein
LPRRALLIISLVVLSLSAGYRLGEALMNHWPAQGVISGVILAIGIVSIGLVVAAGRRLPADLLFELEQREAYEAAVATAPRLGEVLVHRYHWITQQDLKQALDYQRRNGRRVGEILIAMGAISSKQLMQALIEQRNESGKAPQLPVRTEEQWTAIRERV